jgi:hypothetical protein
MMFFAAFSSRSSTSPQDGQTWVRTDSLKSSCVVDVLLVGLVPAAPALLAVGYTVRTVGTICRSTPAEEEQGSLDIALEPMGNEKR